MFKVEQRTEALSPRDAGELVNEAFLIFGRHLRRFIVLVAVVQVPVNIVSLLLGGGMVAYAVGGALGLFGSIIVYAMLVDAVGQHYVTGGVDVRRSYRKAWDRIASLSILTGIAALALVAVAAPVTVIDNAVLFLVALIAVAAIAVVVYLSMAVQVVIVEHAKAFDALRRSYLLVRGRWWRVFGVIALFFLVGFGLSLVVALPIALVVGIANPVAGSLSSDVLQFVSGVAVTLAVSPVIYIGGTLLYYDLRVRRESYNISVLSSEMGLALA